MSSNGEARGLKRQADDTLDDEQRFAKRFNLLNLGTFYFYVHQQGSSIANLYLYRPQWQTLHPCVRAFGNPTHPRSIVVPSTTSPVTRPEYQR